MVIGQNIFLSTIKLKSIIDKLRNISIQNTSFWKRKKKTNKKTTKQIFLRIFENAFSVLKLQKHIEYRHVHISCKHFC